MFSFMPPEAGQGAGGGEVEDDLLSIRDAFLRSKRKWPFIVVHGHTPEPKVHVDIAALASDTGAYATGRLSAVRLEVIMYASSRPNAGAAGFSFVRHPARGAKQNTSNTRDWCRCGMISDSGTRRSYDALIGLFVMVATLAREQSVP